MHGADVTGSTVFSRRITRQKLLEFFASQRRCVVALEACGGAHHWGRELIKLGYPAVRSVCRAAGPCSTNHLRPRGNSRYPTNMGSRGRALLAMAQGLGVWLLEAREGFGEHSFHSHHAIQLTVCFDGNLSLIGDEGPVSGNVIAVAHDVRHQLRANGVIGIIFVEPESPRGTALSKMLFADQGLVKLDAPEFDRLLEPLRHGFELPLSHEDMLALGSRAIDALAVVEPVEATDSRVLSIIEHTASHLELPISLKRAAGAAGVFLSESRLRHLFVEQTGLAFKTYILWLRLVRAVQLYSEGHSLTESAHLAGFADSAHFSRAFKRTFGAPATTLTRL